MIGERIKQIRTDLGLTQRQFASMLGIKDAYVSMLEKGKNVPSEQLILNICRRYDVNREWLEEGKGERWDHSHRTTKGRQLIDEICDRLLRADIQVPLTSIAKIVNIDVDRFPEDPHKVIRFVDDDVSDLFDAFIAVLREGNRIKISAIKALLYTFVPKKTPQQLSQALLEETLINTKERIAWAKRAELANNLTEAREEWLKAIETLRLLSIARSEETPHNIMQEYEEFLNRDSVYAANIEKLISIVEKTPGTKEADLYKCFPDLKRKDVFYVLRVAQCQGRIAIRKRGSVHRLYPN